MSTTRHIAHLHAYLVKMEARVTHELAEARHHDEIEGDNGADRIAGQAEDELGSTRVNASGKRGGFAGLHVQTSEMDAAAKVLLEHVFDQILNAPQKRS